MLEEYPSWSPGRVWTCWHEVLQNQRCQVNGSHGDGADQADPTRDWSRDAGALRGLRVDPVDC